jgi:hypothetical protein
VSLGLSIPLIGRVLELVAILAGTGVLVLEGVTCSKHRLWRHDVGHG